MVVPPGEGREWDVPPDDREPAELPAWLAARMRDTNGHRPAVEPGEPIREGERDDTLTSMAGAMRRRGMDAEEIAAGLTAVNARRCDPPLPSSSVRKIAAGAERWEPAADSRPAGRRVVLTAASSISPEPLRWLWRHRLPLRGLSLIAGEPGLGKSTLTVELAAAVTRGKLDGDLHGEPRDVLIASAEDHFPSVVWGRLMAAGADMARVHRLHVEDRDGEELLTLPDDVAEIEARCAELADAGRPVALVVVDPVAAFIGGGVDTHRDASVRRVLAPLAGLAERQHLAVSGVAHLTKDTAAKLLARVGGSVAFGAAPRSVLAFACDPDDEDGERGTKRVIVHAKSNHGRYAPSLAAQIEEREVPEVGEVSRLVIVGECEVVPEDLHPQTDSEHHDRDAAAEWLADELADEQWHRSGEVKAAGKAAGHSVRTIQRAKSSLGVEDRREGFQAVSEWRLPVAPTPRGATGATGATAIGATGESRMGSGIGADPSPSRATSPGGGATGEKGRPRAGEEGAAPHPGQASEDGPERGTNGWPLEAADNFIREALDVFPGSAEIDAAGRLVADEDDLSDLGPCPCEPPPTRDELKDGRHRECGLVVETPRQLDNPAPRANPPETCDGKGHKQQPYQDEDGDWRCFRCGRACDPPDDAP